VVRFQLGDYWLSKRDTGWCRTWYDCEARQTRRVSLRTPDFERAKELLEDWYIANRKLRFEKPADVTVAEIIGRYWEEHGSKVRSADGNRHALNAWLDYWGEATVEDLRDVQRQEAFHLSLARRGQKQSTIARTVNIGKAAVSRAFKRGMITSPPYIMPVVVKSHPPRGRPLSVDELQALYRASVPHVQTFIRWMLGTAARPEAILELRRDQVKDGLVFLNPDGREQTKKHRPTVRLPDSLSDEVWDDYLIQYGGDRVRSIKKAFQRGRERAGLGDQVTPYSLRHSSARWMRANGVPADDVSLQLGHTRNRVTEIYTAYDPAYLKAACGSLDTLVRAVCVR
jgi:integrase